MVLLVEVTLSNLGAGLAAIAIIGLLSGYFAFNWKKGSSEAGDRELRNWKGLAESEIAKNVLLEAENVRLKEKLSDCEQLKNDFAQHVLRAAARERKYQYSINTLERAAGVMVTDFDDIIHATEDSRR